MNEHKTHCLLKYLGLVFATILGAFLAFYFVLNTTINHLMSPYYTMNQMDKMIPGMANDDILLYGVETKFYSAKVQLNNKLETSIKDLYCIGDGSGWTRSLSQASASGIYVANNILEK